MADILVKALIVYVVWSAAGLAAWGLFVTAGFRFEVRRVAERDAAGAVTRAG